MDRGLGLSTVTSLRVVETMHARKALMAELADAFIAMPGGYGTAEEFFEALTWRSSGCTPSLAACSTSTAISTI